MKHSGKSNGSVEVVPAVISLAPKSETGRVARIDAFEVTSDSVVVTARVEISAATRRIEMVWGLSGPRELIRVRPGIPEQPAPGTNALPRGVYEFQHVFPPSEDGRSFQKSIYVWTRDADNTFDVRERPVTITPRWRIVHYPLSFQLGEDCAPANRSSVDVSVTQTVDGEVTKVFEQQVSHNSIISGQRFRLEGSGVTFEAGATPTGQVPEFKAVSFRFDLSERGTDEGRTSFLYTGLGFEEAFLAGEVSQRIETVTSGDCRIACAFGRDASLVTPLTRQSGGVFAPVL